METTIELIPWMHRATLLCHEDVVNYIKKQPKNSYLALEISPNNLSDKNVIMDYISEKSRFRRLDLKEGKRINEIEFIRNLLSKEAEDFWAYMEVISECNKRNIKIVPLETFVSRERVIREKPEKEKSAKQKYTDIFIFREKTFARQIKSLISNLRGAKITVLTGLGHTYNLQIELQRLGIQSKVNTSIFTQRTNMEKALETEYKRQFALLRGDETAAKSHKTKPYQLLEAKRKKGKRTGLIIKKIRTELRARRKIQKRRIARKALHRRRR